MTSAVNTDLNISYTYNYDGIRTSKTINGVTTYYEVDENNNVVKQYELADGAETNAIEFVYGSDGTPVYFTCNGEIYYYEKNLQGDIVAILDVAGNTVVEYSYDIWGKLLGITGELADTLGTANPLRYRGYYYDDETGLYYLQSRYYSPDLMRFLSQDDVKLSNDQGQPLGSNLYVYCLNNPVMNSDPTGYNSAILRRQAGSATTFLAILLVVIKGCSAAGSTNFWNPVGWVLLAVAGVAMATFGVWSLTSYPSDKSLKADLTLIASSSTAATPPPPNKGGRGVQTSSKTLYNKKGSRIDVENPGNRQGQIHLQKGRSKYYYNIQDQAFHIGSSNGQLAPKSIQNLLKEKDVIKAIAKGLRILGY